MSEKNDFESIIEDIAYWGGKALRFLLLYSADILFIVLVLNLWVYSGSAKDYLYLISFYLVHLSLKME